MFRKGKLLSNTLIKRKSLPPRHHDLNLSPLPISSTLTVLPTPNTKPQNPSPLPPYLPPKSRLICAINAVGLPTLHLIFPRISPVYCKPPMRSARIIPSPLYVSHLNSSEARRKIVVVGTYLFTVFLWVRVLW